LRNDKAVIDADIQSVKNQLAKLSIDSTGAHEMLRGALKVSPPAGDAQSSMAALFERALEKTGGDTLSAGVTLQALLEEPTTILKSLFFDVKGIEPPKPDGVLEQPAMAAKQAAANTLAELSQRVTEIEYALLKDVRGQNHAVHTFAQGIFSAEVLADDAKDRVDDGKDRKPPRAIFVFAGPPGVGKTFLAKNAAKLLGLPFKQFDMSGYSDHQAHVNLIGYNKSYKSARPGILTNFVKQNPNCLLLFDEIEKAHINTIHLFFFFF
jgi:Cdc6-like AAA superfamily ATPase